MTFEYKCKKCGELAEFDFRLEDRNVLMICKCGGDYKRVYSVSFQPCKGMYSYKGRK